MLTCGSRWTKAPWALCTATAQMLRGFDAREIAITLRAVDETGTQKPGISRFSALQRARSCGTSSRKRFYRVLLRQLRFPPAQQEINSRGRGGRVTPVLLRPCQSPLCSPLRKLSHNSRSRSGAALAAAGRSRPSSHRFASLARERGPVSIRAAAVARSRAGQVAHF